MSPAAVAALGGAAVRNDMYDFQWAALEPERRMRKAAPVAAAMARCVAVRDREGVRKLLARYRDRHWSLPVTLAVTADLRLTAMIARTAPEAAVRRAARTACELIPVVVTGMEWAAMDVLARRAAAPESYAALVIVLAEAYRPASLSETP